ncbi:4Fe-4S binding protein [Intestinibacillus massiliensis]|uniref:4Fe-4S dicluster domain-containing protein n=1 Tax=Intestinibacillus massiliensis TaxID=1871029 RepID=UPI001D0914D7|nr:4Fe-4S dicluster domain-containing protein [Intestinibacillus massiliensis]MCB6366370.1 4Fe-4S binding protein [Intestinibacillus massiliensis]
MTPFKFGRMIAASLFRKPATTAYPVVPREYPEHTRGKVAIEIDDCIFCGMCMRKCPADAIKVDRNAKTWQINPFSCIQCACCVTNCPKKCLHMDKAYTQPAPSKSEEVFHARVPDHPEDRGDREPAG